LRRLRLRAVVALDDDEIDLRMRQPQRLGALIFVGAVAGERSGVIGEFAQHRAGTNAALHYFHVAAAHQRGAAIFFMGRRRRRHIGLVAFRIADVDLRNPIALGHGALRQKAAKITAAGRRSLR
jgi:hypothetical protein